MRVVMIHAIAESIPPVRMAFGDVFPEAEVVNLLDEGLLIDFDGKLTLQLIRRMSSLVSYSADHGADAIGLACSVYAPAVKTIKHLVDVPLVSSYGPVMADAVALGPKIGIIASVPATIRDAEHYLWEEAKQQNAKIEPYPRLAEDLIQVLRQEGEAGFQKRLAEEVNSLGPQVDAVLLSQFSMATAFDHVSKNCPVPVLSPAHSSARRLKELLQAA
ncbi:MAG: hypothetical protein BZY88_09565 [SAR202 cluster bacterium Io17-Chloro-G9]|nr:MAG: hypothetical protein BZY88_09565 [SAR202 cluster bacterium Io17-Chloro-G9]